MPRYFLRVALALGVLLAAVNFAYNRSLWLDEASLALNLAERSYGQLLHPLDHRQVAPVGFLLVVKLLAEPFQYADWSLRLFPFFSYLVSVYLLHTVAKLVLKDARAALFCTAFYTLSYFPIYYSGEVKQYMSDLAIGLAITLAGLKAINPGSNPGFRWFALPGALSIWFSNVAVIVLFPVGLLLLEHHRHDRRTLGKVFLTLLAWSLSSVVYYLLFIHDHPTRPFMIQYWRQAGAFLPLNVLAVDFLVGLLGKVKTYFGLSGIRGLSLIALPLYGTGLYLLAKNQRRLLFILLTPPALHLLLAYLSLYPFAPRIILYLYPAIVIISAGGLLHYVAWLEKKIRLPAAWPLLCALALNLGIVFARGYPTEQENIKAPLSILDTELVAGDKLFLYYGARRAFSFYRNRYPRLAALSDGMIIVSQQHRAAPRKYADYLSGIDRPTWLLFSHVYRPPGADSEEAVILRQCARAGLRVSVAHRFRGAALYRMLPDTAIMSTPPGVHPPSSEPDR